MVRENRRTISLQSEMQNTKSRLRGKAAPDKGTTAREEGRTEKAGMRVTFGVRATVAFAVACVGFACADPGGSESSKSSLVDKDSGVNTKDELREKYLAALRAGDKEKMLSLYHPKARSAIDKHPGSKQIFESTFKPKLPETNEALTKKFGDFPAGEKPRGAEWVVKPTHRLHMKWVEEKELYSQDHVIQRPAIKKDGKWYLTLAKPAS